MIKLIRANQKKFLAGLTIFSMVGFLVNRGNGTRDGSTDRPYGTVHGKTINISEMAQARAEITAMRSSLATELPDFVNQPELFMLLKHEADEAGMRADPALVTSIMDERKRAGADPDNDDALRAGLSDLIKIRANYGRVLSAIKVSQPAAEKQLAEQSQSILAKIVQVSTDPFMDKVPAPTTQQAQEQFNKFSDNLAHHPLPTTNPFGFGYKIPDRVSFELLRLSDDAVTAAVVASQSQFDWSVQALKYYHNNIEEYRQAPTTSPSTQPIYKPESQVDAQILTLLRKDQISDLRRNIETYIATTMDADWSAYSQFIAAGSHGNEPDSSLGTPYSSDKYLLKMFDSVKTKFNVNLVADKSPGLLTREQLGPFGEATGQYINRQMADYLARSSANDPQAAAILRKPSDPLPDVSPTASVFVRLLTVEKAAPPPDIAPIRTLIDNDIKLSRAFELAKAQAASLVPAAQADKLDAAAKDKGLTVIQPDPKSPIMFESTNVSGITPSLHESGPEFARQVFSLLDNYDPSKATHPATTIELPILSRVFVVELVGVDTKWDTQQFMTDYQQATVKVFKQIAGPTAADWFSLEKVKARLKFQLAK